MTALFPKPMQLQHRRGRMRRRREHLAIPGARPPQVCGASSASLGGDPAADLAIRELPLRTGAGKIRLIARRKRRECGLS